MPAHSPTKLQRSGRFRPTLNPNLIPRRSSRRTPQPELLRHPSPSKTVISTASNKTGKHNTSGPATAVHQDGAPKSSVCENGVQGNVVRKRNVGAGVNDKKKNAVKSGGTLDTFEQNIDQENEAQRIDFHSNSENLQTGVAEPHGKKRKKRRSIGQIQRKKPRTQNVEDQLDNEESEQTKALTLTRRSAENSVEHSTNTVEGFLQPLGRSAVIGSLSEPQNSVPGGRAEQDLKRVVPKVKAQPKTRRKKRKSIGQIQAPRKRLSTEIKHERAVRTTESIRTKSSKSNQNTIGQAALKISRGRGRPKKLAPQIQEETIVDEIIQPKSKSPEGIGIELQESKDQFEKSLPPVGEARQEEVTGTITQNETKEQPAPLAKKRGRPPKRVLSDVINSSNVENLKQLQKRKAKTSTFNRRIEATMSRKPPKNPALITTYRSLLSVAPDYDDSEFDTLGITACKKNIANAADAPGQACHEVGKRKKSLDPETQEQTGELDRGDNGCTTSMINRHGEGPANHLSEMVSIPRFG